VYLEELRDLKICRRASHLLFADDNLLFFEANAAQACIIKATIGIFEIGSGQLVNPSKCSIMFNENCPEEIQGNILAILEVEQSSFEEKYLGLPTPDGRMKASRFQPLKERFRKRLTDREICISGCKRSIDKICGLSTYSLCHGSVQAPRWFP
jgi:hypothetical protein